MTLRAVEAMMVVAVLAAAFLLPPVSSEIIFPVADCRDGSTRCPGLAADGVCVSNPTYMRNVCPASCGMCSTTTTTAGTTTTTTTAGTTTTTTAGTTTTTTNTPGTTTTATTSQHDAASPSSAPSSGFQTTTTEPTRSITNSDIACGGSPAHSRRTRQAAVEGQDREESPVTFMISNPEGGVQPVSHESCGASVISDRFLLTAAYCVLDPEHPISSVRLGDLDLATDGENNSSPADYNIIKIILPPTFSETNGVLYDDIALLKTDRKIEFNDVVFPYCLPSHPPAPGTTVIASGFGYVNETHKSTHLMEGLLTVLPLVQCEARYLEEEEQRLRTAYPALLQGRKGLLCAGDVKRGVCKGDEGGPLFWEDDKGRRFLEGITSFTGTVCGDGILPGVFTAVADYMDFINSVIYSSK